MKDSSFEKIVQDQDGQCPRVDTCNDPCKLVIVDMADASEQSESVKCPKCECETLPTTEASSSNRTNKSIVCGTKQLCSQSDGSNPNVDESQPNKSMKPKGDLGHTDPVKLPSKPTVPRKRCPDIACGYPCYIYKVGLDCPRCACPGKMDQKSLLNKKFVATSNLSIQNDH